MEGAVAQGVLSRQEPSPAHRGLRFDVACDADEPQVRRVLRDNPMHGVIRLSMQREPDSRIAAQIEGPILHQTIVGRRADGGIFGVGTRSVRMCYFNGRPMPIGYLGMLRLDRDYRLRPRVVIEGYRRLQELHDADGAASVYFTSILSDNRAARRLLEASLPGMPTYRFVSDFVTLIFRPRRFAGRVDAAEAGDAEELRALVNDCNRRNQFSPHWSPGEVAALAPRGLPASAFRVAANASGALACAALWDVRSFKQTVVRGYARGMNVLRHGLNLVAPLTGLPRFPAVGQALRCAFLSQLASPPDRHELIVPLARSLGTHASTLGIDCIIAGFPPSDPRLEALRCAFGGRELRSRLYLVYWPDGRSVADSLDGRPCCPEVALL